MTTLKIRSYQDEADREAIVNLVHTCEAVERFPDESSISDIILKLNSPRVDKFSDVRLWEDNGNLIGLSILDIWKSNHLVDANLSYYFHPEKHHYSLELDMLNWAEKRMSEIGRELGVYVKLQTYTRDDQLTKNIFLKQHSFTIDRYFFTMAISLNRSLPKPQFPDGFKLFTMADIQDNKSWVEMYNESFIDHWNHHNLDFDTVENWFTNPYYQPELNLVAVAPDQTFAAFCKCQIQITENLNSGIKTGWIELLGTRRGFRRRGLGKAMLLAGLNKLKASGAAIAKLSVDSESPTGANILYESVGFNHVNTWFSWQK